MLILNLQNVSYFTLSQFDGYSVCLDRHLWQFSRRSECKRQRHGTTSQALFILPLQEACTFLPSFPCPQSTPLSILPQDCPAFRSEYCHPFRKFDLSRFGSAFLPTAAWLVRTSMASRHLRVIRAPIMKSKPVAITLRYLADVCMRLAQIGDQAFGLAVTDLIQDLYPYLRVGPASVR